jgi:DNA helicase HerA-like ATPase
MNLMEELKKFISEEGVSLYIDASRIGTTDGVGGMVVDLISNYLLSQPKQKDCAFVIFVDEVHRYARKITEPGAYYSGLTSIAREGRKKGIFLFLTTQNPNDVSPELLGQVGTLLVHRVTHQNEIDAIRNSVDEHSLGQIKKLNQGEAILTSVNLLEDLHISIDACSRIHENNTPQL